MANRYVEECYMPTNVLVAVCAWVDQVRPTCHTDVCKSVYSNMLLS